MKNRTRNIALAFTVVLLVAVVAFFSLRPPVLPPEPVYQGKTVDEWLDTMIVPFSGPLSPSYDALKAIGPGAVPFIFRKLRRNDSPWLHAYRQILRNSPVIVRRFLPVKRVVFDSHNAAEALMEIGPNAAPALPPLLRDSNPAVREAAWMGMSFIGNGSLPTNEMISTCIRALRDNDAEVRVHAAINISRLGPSGSNAVPDLIRTLSSNEAGRDENRATTCPVHQDAALALGYIGPAAATAIPALNNLIATTNGYTRVCAAIGLWQITSNAAPTLAVLTNGFCNNFPLTPLKALEEMGPQAKAASPLVIEQLNRSLVPPMSSYYPLMFTAASNTLVSIDPEAATKYFSQPREPR